MLTATGALLAGTSLAGCLAGGHLGASDGPKSDETKTDDEANADRTIQVGPGGELAFVSDDITVHPGQTVAWEWESDAHNIVVQDQPDGANWEGTPGTETKIYDKGYRYTHTFETLGEYEYVCQPHRAAGMVGSVTVAPETETTETTETTDEKPPATEDCSVEVGPGGNLTFAPGTERPLKIAAGTEVTFVWESDTHNVAVESQPEGANWEGSPGGNGKTYDAGYEFSHTFEVPGKYEYYCVPHETAGMKGAIIVE